MYATLIHRNSIKIQISQICYKYERCSVLKELRIILEELKKKYITLTVSLMQIKLQILTETDH